MKGQFRKSGDVRVGDGRQKDQLSAPAAQQLQIAAHPGEHAPAAHPVVRLLHSIHRDVDHVQKLPQNRCKAVDQGSVGHHSNPESPPGEPFGKFRKATVQKRFSAPEHHFGGHPGGPGGFLQRVGDIPPGFHRKFALFRREHSLRLPAEAAGEIAAPRQLKVRGKKCRFHDRIFPVFGAGPQCHFIQYSAAERGFQHSTPPRIDFPAARRYFIRMTREKNKGNPP